MIPYMIFYHYCIFDTYLDVSETFSFFDDEEEDDALTLWLSVVGAMSVLRLYVWLPFYLQSKMK